MATKTVKVRNQSNNMVLVGEHYLLSGQSREVRVRHYEAADRLNPGALVLLVEPNQPDGSWLVEFSDGSSVTAEIVEEAEEGTGEDAAETSEEANAADGNNDEPVADAILGFDPPLDSLTKAELSQLAADYGIAPGKKTKAQLIAEITAYADTHPELFGDSAADEGQEPEGDE